MTFLLLVKSKTRILETENPFQSDDEIGRSVSKSQGSEFYSTKNKNFGLKKRGEGNLI